MTTPPKDTDIEALVALFDKSDWNEMHISAEGFELFLSKDPNAQPSTGGVIAASAPVLSAPVVSKSEPSPQTPAPPKVEETPAHWVPIKAPNLGTFYLSPKPDSPPFVTVGAAVTPQTEVCLVEVMKLFTSLTAGTTGIVRKICAVDGQLIEHGQLLFWIEPT